MRKKYIIELEDNKLAYQAIMIDGTPYIKPLQLLPYTTDIERVKKTAHDDGYSEGYQAGREDLNRVMSNIEQVKEEAYQKGYETGYEDGYNEPGKNQQEAYQRGLADAWEAARKIVIGDINIIVSVFGSASRSIIIRDLTAAEVIEKLRAYEQEQDEKKKTDYYFDMMKDAIETSAKEYGMSLDEVAAVLEKMRRIAPKEV